MGERRLCPACRKTLLSRYGKGPVCAPCARAASSTAEIVPAWLWDSQALRTALRDLNLGGFIALVRSALGMSQLEFSHLVGWCQSLVARVESGERDTLYDIRELLRVADAIGMPRHTLLPMLTGVPVPEADNTCAMDIDRRRFSGLAAGAAMAALGGMQIPDRVDAGHIRHIHASITRLRDHDQRFGGGLLVQSATQQLARVRAMLDRADYTEPIGRQLLAAVGELSACVAWLAYDAGHRAQARRLYGEAQMYAVQSGDLRLHVHTAAQAAMQAIDLATTHPGTAREALRFLASAKESARFIGTPRLYALLALREADAHALLQDEIAYRRALSTAWREFDRGTSTNDPPWLGFVTEGEMKSVEGGAAIALGDHDTAEQRFREAMTDPATGARNRLSAHIWLVFALTARGDHHTAYQEALAAFPHFTGQMASPRLLARLRSLRDHTAHQRDSLADEFARTYDQLASA